MRLLYINNTDCPSFYANSINTINMCESFSKIINTQLIIPIKLWKYNHITYKKNIFKFYNVTNHFNLKRLFLTPKISGLNNFYKRAIMCASNDDLIYTRDINCVKLCLKNKKYVIYECHSYNKILSSYIDNKYLILVSFITQNLADLFNIKNKYIISPDASRDYYYDNNIEGKSITIGYLGSCSKGRGIEQLIDYGLKNNDKKILIGGMTLKECNIKLNKNFTLSKNINFFGKIKPKNVKCFYKLCDILYMGYNNKVTIDNNKGNTIDIMSPLKLFEAMSTAKPFIAPSISTITSILPENMHKYLLTKIDDNSIKRFIFDFSNNKKKYLTDFEAVRKLYLSDYTWDKRAANIIDKINSYNIFDG